MQTLFFAKHRHTGTAITFYAADQQSALNWAAKHLREPDSWVIAPVDSLVYTESLESNFLTLFKQ